MDSLTQIILGAAVGEVVLGRKAGNRAMLWGGVAGTIPDLDVLATFFTDEMTALAFHRGFMHSITFAIMVPFIIGWLVHRLYDSGLYQMENYRGWSMVFWMFLYALAGIGLPFLPTMAGGAFSPVLLGVSILGGVILGRHLWKSYYKKEPDNIETTYANWFWLFFWAILTHPLLDSCTTFGTQLFLPFSDYRVGFNIVSVADPIYTIPFLLFVIVAAWQLRHHRMRRWFNWAGVLISSAYLLFTYYHKTLVNTAFEESLSEKNIPYDRYMTSPTIFNNILWNCVAEGEDDFYMGLYSLYDQKPYFRILETIPKNHELLAPYEGQRTTKILQWFSNEYYTLSRDQDDVLYLNDLRFGSIDIEKTEEPNFVFKFRLEDVDGKLEATQKRGVEEGEDAAFGALWRRINGNN